jgi:hypothetical protein
LKLIENIVLEGQQQGLFQPNINVALLPTTIIGSFLNFQMNKPYYQELFDLKTEKSFEDYISNDFTQHIQKTIKALLVYAN